MKRHGHECSRIWKLSGNFIKKCRDFLGRDILVTPFFRAESSLIQSLIIFSFICMFCRSLFVLFVLFLLAIVLSVLLRITDSDYLPLLSSNYSYSWPLCCLSSFESRILITSLWYLQTLLRHLHHTCCSSFHFFVLWDNK
jgi:hypothetical protein